MLKEMYKKINQVVKKRWHFDLLLVLVVLLVTIIWLKNDFSVYLGKPFWMPFFIALCFEIGIGGMFASSKVSTLGKKVLPGLVLVSILVLFVLVACETDSKLPHNAVYALFGGYFGGRLATYLMPCILKCCIFKQQSSATVGGNGTGTQPGDKVD